MCRGSSDMPMSDTYMGMVLNSLRPRRNRHHFADDIFKCIFENENEWISPKISLKFVHNVRINNIPALVQIMAWRRPDDKPLSAPIMVSLLTHICVTRPQWIIMWRHKISFSKTQLLTSIHYHLHVLDWVHTKLTFYYDCSNAHAIHHKYRLKRKENK